MTSNQLVAFGLITALSIAVFGGLIEPYYPVFAGSIYVLSGIGMFVFGIWASVKLLNKSQAKA